MYRFRGNPESSYGWLNRKGEFFGCHKNEYDTMDICTGKSALHCENEGWCWVTPARWLTNWDLSPAQKRFLTSKGHNVNVPNDQIPTLPMGLDHRYR
jgi:hypothetical protein